MAICIPSSPPPTSPSLRKTLLLFSLSANTKTRINNKNVGSTTWQIKNGRALTLGPPLSLPQDQQKHKDVNTEEDDDENEDENTAQGRGRGNWTIVLSSSLVGLLTGVGESFSSITQIMRYVIDVFWDGIPQRGASWL